MKNIKEDIFETIIEILISTIFMIAMLTVICIIQAYAGIETINNVDETVVSSKQEPRIGRAVIIKEDGVLYDVETGKPLVTDKPNHKGAYLGTDGVADAPLYGNVTIELEKNIASGAKNGSSLLYKTSPAASNIQYPEVNPATGQPLWATQPFWREDGSFDIYGYLKQFKPIFKGTFADITLKKIDGKGTSIALCFRPKNNGQFPTTYLDIPLVEDEHIKSCIENEYVDFDYASARCVGLLDFRPTSENNSILERNGYINLSDLLEGGKARVTGTDDCYIYSAVIPQLEVIVRQWMMDPTGNTFKNQAPWIEGETSIYYGTLEVGSGPTSP